MSTKSHSERAEVGSTDDGIIDGICARDDEAWNRFVEQYSPLIYVWCRNCDLQSADAMDVAQMVFQTVSRSISTFSKQPGGSFRGWLFTVTKRLILNYLNRTLRGPKPRGGSSIQIRLMEEPDRFSEESLSATHCADQDSLMNSILDKVRSKFDERTWQCFWLVAIEEKPAVDVARQLGMKPAAVRQAKYRVTQSLRKNLEDFS